MERGLNSLKSMYTRSLALLFALAMALSLAACGNDETDTPSSAGESADAPYELQMEISQEDWNDNRQYIELSTGITMAYVEMGDPEGDPVLLIHGSTDNSRSWSMAAPYFAKAGYHVYMPDLRGHGYTEKPETGMYTVGDYAGDIAAFMEAKGIEKADIVGHSMGSAAAQAFLLTFPEKCGHVVLVSSSPVRARGVGTYEMAITLGEDEHPSDEFMDSWYVNPNPVDEEFLSYEMKESQRLDANAWTCIGAGSAVMDLTILYPYMDTSIPVLILYGSADSFTNPEEQEELKAAFSHADYITYDGIGHNIQWEIPEQCAEDILAFIAQ